MSDELYDYLSDEDAGHDDHPPEQENITWERIEYPSGAAFVDGRTPEDEAPF